MALLPAPAPVADSEQSSVWHSSGPALLPRRESYQIGSHNWNVEPLPKTLVTETSPWCARAMSWAYSWRVVGTIGLAAAILYLWARPAWHALTWRNILRLSPAEMVLLIAADVVVVILHECAHACSVQHFGGRARKR